MEKLLDEVKKGIILKNKVVFVTGGASGLGRVLVKEFVSEGAKVCFTYRNSEAKAKEISEKYKDCVLAIKADASVQKEAENSVAKCIDKFGTVHVLVNNAASARDGSIEKINIGQFDYTIQNVLYPVFHYTKAVVPAFIAQAGGKIINIGSINGMRGREGSLAYSTAKAGIEGFTKTIAKELGKYNICCNVVAPGFINTDGQAGTSELIKKLVLDECAIRKLTDPVEVAHLVLFLAGDKSDNITGQVYKIDCGQYI